jgi:tetratricopeptide (TPR) repeat protein
MSAQKRIAGALYVERRRAQRATVSLRVVYVNAGLIVEARTIDVSETGMCLQTHIALDLGTRLELRFSADAKSFSTYRIDGDVMWVRPGDSVGGEETFHNGLRFLEMPQDVRAELKRVVAQHVVAPAEELPEVAANEVIALEEDVTLGDAIAKDHARQKADSDNSRSALAAGRSAADRGAVDEAVAHFERAVRLAPHSEDALEELGRMMYVKGNVVRAAALFDRALQLRQERES